MKAEGENFFGKYILLQRLARGGMGEIYLAKQRDPGGFERLLVIKKILVQHLDKPQYIDMFFREARLVARLNHRNIVQIKEMGEIEGDYYIAMEYVRGKSLRDVLDRLRDQGEHLALGHVVALAIDLCEGIGHAHRARGSKGRPMNIVHRDINPQNILISYSGELKLIDFGIAKSEMAAANTHSGTIKGKFTYMSPEQSAADPIDRRSDIFSLGIVLYEMACLENPFARQNVILSLEAIQQTPAKPISSRRKGTEVLEAILRRALAKNPAERFQSAIDMRDSLRILAREGSVSMPDASLGAVMNRLFAEEIADEEITLSFAPGESDQGQEHKDTRSWGRPDQRLTALELAEAPTELTGPLGLDRVEERKQLRGWLSCSRFRWLVRRFCSLTKLLAIS